MKQLWTKHHYLKTCYNCYFIVISHFLPQKIDDVLSLTRRQVRGTSRKGLEELQNMCPAVEDLWKREPKTGLGELKTIADWDLTPVRQLGVRCGVVDFGIRQGEKCWATGGHPWDNLLGWPGCYTVGTAGGERRDEMYGQGVQGLRKEFQRTTQNRDTFTLSEG